MKPHKKARKITLENGDWYWMMDRTRTKLILWNPERKKSVHDRDEWTYEMRELVHF